MSEQPNSFAGKISEEYDLTLKITPHYMRVQSSVTDAIKKYCARVRKEDIVTVLEIGTGTGLTTEKILSVDKRIRMVSIDPSANMLRQAEERLAKYSKEYRLILYQKEANAFLENNCWCHNFDIVASAYTIHNLPTEEKIRLSRNIYRVLAPRGILVEADIIAPNNPEDHRRELAWMINNIKGLDAIGKSEVKREWLAHYTYDDQPGIKMTEAELREMLAGAGFRSVRKKYREHMEATFVARK